ncbi:hypothetical protein ASE70_07980 [Sphingomonas sp. Leaf22]|uniref:hypothetical protein n=1 Tax=Sphingomonas sp. Leaf22 TaxID=1735687 RepID=UPI0006F64693|nr:hypothetical protein [Sphingomonas sp. Leaf22]KQM76700.1 hypothetical protein ASE70_07980 [Sphingomonas sp. Leaf22]
MTLRLSPQMTEALSSGLFPIAPLIEIEMPNYTLRHIVGGGELLWGTKRFRGRDPRFGTLVSASTLHDGVADEAPEWMLTFCPPGAVGVQDLTRADVQESPVRAWLAAVDRASGQILPEPIQVFEGLLDVAQLTVGKGTRTVEWRCVSALERFHDKERGARLSDAHHRLVWPGETGCANMSGIEKTSYWGVEKVPGGVTYGTGGGGGSVYYTGYEQ